MSQQLTSFLYSQRQRYFATQLAALPLPPEPQLPTRPTARINCCEYGFFYNKRQKNIFRTKAKNSKPKRKEHRA